MPHAEEEQPNGHSFWDQDAVPGENDNDFKPFKSREYTGAAGIFRPKDEHCGIWHSPPNKRCYASFGDQGTTASVGCYGNLVRMIQYLGVGHSGVFSLDQTDEPYNIKLRAEQLDDLSADIHTGNYTLEFPPSGDLSRNEPLEVKWVNWRWPRYEYETSHPGVKALIQWIVHKNIVLQQLVLENASEKSVKVVSTLNTNMKTQDLDFLDRRYPIDYDEEGDYTHGMGPKGYGHIYVHALRDDNSSSLKEVHSVASVTALFVNGEAVKMGDGPEIQNHHTLEGQSSVEMVVAYKMITIPASKVDWRNFLVTAEEADVSSILRKESDELWKSAGDISLCSLGLSTIDLTGPMRKAREGTDAGDEGNKGMKSAGRKAPNGMAVSENKKVEGTSTANKGDADTETSMDAKGADPGPSMPSKTERFGFPSGTPDKTSPRNHIEYLAWRHLEHILSVCAVPLSAPQLYENNTCSNTDDITPVALTCGDMFSHRILTSASFFAFQFLVDVARRLEHFERKIPYILRLEQRIKAVCRGHIKWLERLLMADQPRLLKSGCFAANYWVTGELQPKSDHSWWTWQPVDGITDTAYQILKMTDYGSFYNDKQMVRHLLEKVRVSWLEELNKLDKRASFAWPHSREGGINIFRLDDHFWVWKALKSMEDFGIVEVGLERTARIAERLVSSKVRRGILENFTTENDVSRKRMLAVTRSARETRFLFHSRDTALFYGYGCGFFVRGSSFDELWKNTIEAQPHHEENEEAGWEKALRYALGIMLGTQGYCLDKQEPAALAKRCVEVLIGSGGHNGFLPGLLDKETKKPAHFWFNQNKAFLYYHDSFEIHHILLTHARRIDGLFQEPIASSQKPQSPDIEQAQKPLNEQDELLHRLFSQMAESNLALTAQPKRQVMMDHPRDQTSDFIINPPDIAPRRNRGRSLTIKKLLPINSLIDVSSIVNLEEEWLYNYPEFLSTEDVDLEKRINSIITSGRFNSDESEGIIADILKKHRCSKKSFSVSLWGVFRVDTPKQKHIGRRQDVRWNPLPLGVGHWMMPSCEFFGAARTAESAKKRFIWLPEATDDYALVCWMASPETEKSAMALFFDRHSKQENHVWDDTTMVLNTWQTELHLSFFVLVDASTPKYNGLPPLTKDPFPGRPKKEIRRASIGFRFDGDFFDRYWTCHLIEYIPGIKPPALPWLDQPGYPFSISNEHTDKQWQQRKILELHLLDRILIYILGGSLEILNQVRQELGVENGTFSLSVLGSRSNLSIKEDDSQNLEQLLQVVDEDLTSALNTLQRWITREKDRGQEQPRWTQNDERKYRGAITKLQGSTERHIRDMRIRRDNMRKLREALSMRRERIRQDLEFHWNENIRYFTYVTVIFLPLGFASSFYSMSGAPDHSLMISLVEFAIAAFAVTVILLLSAKSVFSAATKFSAASRTRTRKATASAMTKSLLASETQEADEHNYGRGKKNQNDGSGQKAHSEEELSGKFSSLISFWLAHIFLEIPTVRVSRALSAMEKGTVSGRAAGDIVFGVVFMPIFGVLCLLRIVVLNIVDLVTKVLDCVKKKSLSTHDTPTEALVEEDRKDEEDQESIIRRFHKMVNLPEAFRPLKSSGKAEKKGE